jgi:hypothetical protein
MSKTCWHGTTCLTTSSSGSQRGAKPLAYMRNRQRRGGQRGVERSVVFGLPHGVKLDRRTRTTAIATKRTSARGTGRCAFDPEQTYAVPD